MYSARLTLPGSLSEDQIATLAQSLDDMAEAHTAMREGKDERRPWHMEWIVPDAPSAADLTARLTLKAKIHDIPGLQIRREDWTVEEIPDKDWLQESYKQFRPFSVGPFFIYGSHYEGDVPDDRMGLQIDAATAFGSGEHGTTAACLEAMAGLKDQGVCPWNVLDMGTGSGILAIAAWKLWHTPLLAVDLEEEAVRVACRHREINQVPSGKTGMVCEQGNGFAAKIVQEKSPFDLIIANILAGPLKDMAEDLAAAADENGYVILSGILQKQADEVLDVYTKNGLVLRERYDRDSWSTLVLQNAA